MGELDDRRLRLASAVTSSICSFENPPLAPPRRGFPPWEAHPGVAGRSCQAMLELRRPPGRFGAGQSSCGEFDTRSAVITRRSILGQRAATPRQHEGRPPRWRTPGPATARTRARSRDEPPALAVGRRTLVGAPSYPARACSCATSPCPTVAARLTGDQLTTPVPEDSVSRDPQCGHEIT